MGGRRGWGDRCAPGLPVQPCSPSIYHSAAPTPPPQRTAQRYRPRARGVSRRARAPPGCCGAVHSPPAPGTAGPGHTWWRARWEPLQRPAPAPSLVYRVRLIESLRVAEAAASSSSSRALLHVPPHPPSLFLRLRASPHGPLSMARGPLAWGGGLVQHSVFSRAVKENDLWPEGRRIRDPDPEHCSPRLRRIVAARRPEPLKAPSSRPRA